MKKELFLGGLFGAAVLASIPIEAAGYADGPDAWRVYGVAAGDMLNVRIGPGADYPRIAALSPDARGLQLVACVPTASREQWFSFSDQMRDVFLSYPAWCLITYQGEQLGWVNRSFLTEDSE